ncbi:glycosyltransferase family 4 protein [Cytobacillus kochii]
MEIINKKRIVFIIGSMRRGGAERVISILANNYAESGWEVDILTLLDDSNDYELNSKIVVNPICGKSNSRLRQMPKWLYDVRKHVKETNPNIIVSFIARVNIVTLLSCIGLKKRIVVSERSDPKADGRSIFVKLATYFLYPSANLIVFQTKWAKSNFPKLIQQNSAIIYNPINIKVEAKKEKSKKIVAVGRLNKEKNHEMLIRAFKEVHFKYPEYELYIYGEGTLREDLERQIHELELLNSVFLPGNVIDIHEKISDAEIFVLPSNYEGMSNALLEAMMMGLPCISTDYPGADEVINDDFNGIIVERDNEQQISRTICELINDPKKRNTLGENGKETVLKMKEKNIIETWKKHLEIEV